MININDLERYAEKYLLTLPEGEDGDMIRREFAKYELDTFIKWLKGKHGNRWVQLTTRSRVV